MKATDNMLALRIILQLTIRHTEKRVNDGGEVGSGEELRESVERIQHEASALVAGEQVDTRRDEERAHEELAVERSVHSNPLLPAPAIKWIVLY